MNDKTLAQWKNKVEPYAREIWEAFLAFEVAKHKVTDRMRAVFKFNSVLLRVDIMGVRFNLKKADKRGTLSIPPIFFDFDVNVKRKDGKDK